MDGRWAADLTCPCSRYAAAMHGQPRYRILTGTRVEVLNTVSDGEPRIHVTREDLAFAELSRTAFDGVILYFTHGEWQISVHADSVELW